MIRYPVTHPTARTRRRTRCIYCGARISGALPLSAKVRYGRQSGGNGRAEQRFAARVACPRHRSLVALDPEYCFLPWSLA